MNNDLFSEELHESDLASFDLILSTFFGVKPPMASAKGEVTPTRDDLLKLSKVAVIPQLPSNENRMIPLSECNHPLHTAMVMCFVAHTMCELVKEESGQIKEQERFSHLKEHWQNVACNIINNLNSLDEDGPERVREALHTDYNLENRNIESFKKRQENFGPYKKYLYRKFDKSKEIMYIAYKAEAMKFLSQKVCLNLMETRDGCQNDRESDASENENFHLAKRIIRKVQNEICKHWKPMVFKLYFHAIFRIIYILMFAYMLCRFPVYRVYDIDELVPTLLTDYFTVYYVLAVLIAQISNTFIKVSDFVIFESYREQEIEKSEKRIPNQKSPFQLQKGLLPSLDRYFKMNSLAFYKIVLILPVLLLEAIKNFSEMRAVKKLFGKRLDKSETEQSDTPIAYVLSVGIPIIMEILYCSLFAIAAISSLRFFYSMKKIGFFVHLIKKMGETVAMFVFVFIVFWMVLAVMHVSVTRAYNPINGTLLHTVAAQGKFEIFGEVQDSDREGTLDACSEFNLTIWKINEMNYEEASCLFRTSVIPFLVFVYIFGTGILLVNLLTAQLTKEYEEESEKSVFYEGYLKYEQQAKIKYKLLLPPPFSFFYVIFRFILSLQSIISSLFVWACCKRASKTIDFLSQIIFKVLVWMLEGYPYGAVKRAGKYSETEGKIKKYLENAPSNIWEKLRESINKFEKNLVNQDNVDNLIEAQQELFSILEKEKYNENTTDRGKSRMALRHESFSNLPMTGSLISSNYETTSEG